MKILPVICPQCSANLSFNEGEEFVVCGHCQTKSFLAKEQETGTDFNQFLSLAKIAEDSRNFSEAFQYYSNALLLDSSNAEAWRGKGYSAGMLSNLVSDRFEECINCHNQSLLVADANSVDLLKIDYAIALFQLAQSYFDLSLDHTVKFISVPDAQIEHADRCRSIITLCEYALSLDPDLSVIKTFINDVASRCEKNRFLDSGLTTFFVSVKNKYAEYRHVESSKSSGQASFGMFILVFAFIVVNYFIAKKFLGVENPIFAVFAGFLLFIPEILIFSGGLLLFAKITGRNEPGQK